MATKKSNARNKARSKRIPTSRRKQSGKKGAKKSGPSHATNMNVAVAIGPSCSTEGSTSSASSLWLLSNEELVSLPSSSKQQNEGLSSMKSGASSGNAISTGSIEKYQYIVPELRGILHLSPQGKDEEDHAVSKKQTLRQENDQSELSVISAFCEEDDQEELFHFLSASKFFQHHKDENEKRRLGVKMNRLALTSPIRVVLSSTNITAEPEINKGKNEPYLLDDESEQRTDSCISASANIPISVSFRSSLLGRIAAGINDATSTTEGKYYLHHKNLVLFSPIENQTKQKGFVNTADINASSSVSCSLQQNNSTFAYSLFDEVEEYSQCGFEIERSDALFEPLDMLGW